MGCEVYASVGGDVERDTNRDSGSSCAGLCGAFISYASGFSAGVATGDTATGRPGGMALMGMGVAIYITELWRDTEGRGAMFGGALDGPQVGAIALVLVGALILLERKAPETKDEATHG